MELTRQSKQTALSTELNLESAKHYADVSQSKNTIRMYASAFRRWCLWAIDHKCSQLPASPSDVAVYIAELADNGKKWATISMAIAAIEYAHTQRQLPSIRSSREVILVSRGIRREIGTAQKGAKALSIDFLKKLCGTFTTDNLLDVRNKSILLIGFTGAFRRSEIVSLLLSDIERRDDGYVLTLRKSKTDQEGKGFKKGIPFGSNNLTCPVTALDRWLVNHPCNAKPGAFLFCSKSGEPLTDWMVNHILKAALDKSGLTTEGYSAHSLRAGFVTAAAQADKRLDQIMDQTGHKSVEMAMRYIRAARTIKDSAVNGIGI